MAVRNTQRNDYIVSATLGDELHERVMHYAKEHDRPTSWVVRKCLEIGMDQLEAKERPVASD